MLGNTLLAAGLEASVTFVAGLSKKTNALFKAVLFKSFENIHIVIYIVEVTIAFSLDLYLFCRVSI